MTNQILSFGKFKGKMFNETPVWYQTWLLKQDWFNKPVAQKPLHQQSLKDWDGYSRKGQAVYDAIFQREMDDADKYDPSDRYGMYHGI
jgi:hypothetical protein